MYTSSYTYTCTHNIHIHIHVHKRKYNDVRGYMCIYVHTCIDTCIYVQIRANICHTVLIQMNYLCGVWRRSLRACAATSIDTSLNWMPSRPRRRRRDLAHRPPSSAQQRAALRSPWLIRHAADNFDFTKPAQMTCCGRSVDRASGCRMWHTYTEVCCVLWTNQTKSRLSWRYHVEIWTYHFWLSQLWLQWYT